MTSILKMVIHLIDNLGYTHRYGSLLVDFPFEPSLPLALAIIFVPTGLNIAKWLARSKSSGSGDSSDFDF